MLASVLKESILGFLIFLIYINDFAQSISSIVQLISDEISIFSAVNGISVFSDLSHKK